MRAFKLYGNVSYQMDTIHQIGEINDPEYDLPWVFYENRKKDRILCLRKDIINAIYIKSGVRPSSREMHCIGVYESKKRVRVVPYCHAYSPQGEESVVAYRELITGKDYAMPLERFLTNFSLDFLYDGSDALALEQ